MKTINPNLMLKINPRTRPFTPEWMLQTLSTLTPSQQAAASGSSMLPHTFKLGQGLTSPQGIYENGGSIATAPKAMALAQAAQDAGVTQALNVNTGGERQSNSTRDILVVCHCEGKLDLRCYDALCRQAKNKGREKMICLNHI